MDRNSADPVAPGLKTEVLAGSSCEILGPGKERRERTTSWKKALSALLLANGRQRVLYQAP
jgi:hypothetical protein